MFYKYFKNTDWVLYIIVILLLVLSIVTIYSLTYAEANKQLLYNQIVFAGVGIILMLGFQIIDYRAIKNLSWVLYFLGIIGLIVVLFAGKEAMGATRWINFGFYQFQPSEFFKIILILTLSSYLSDKEEVGAKEIIISLVLIAIPIALVLRQPDMGTAIILTIIGLSILAASGLLKKYIFSLAVLTGIAIPVFWSFVLKPYQKLRILSFLNPQADPFGSGYHVLQSTIAVGSGMVFGRGLGKGFQSQLKFLPAPHTDFIFAVLAEGLGLVGVLVLLILLFILISRIIHAIRITSNKFAYLICVSASAFLVAQVFINIGMNIGIAPVTGIPLPFISYGGSHLTISLILIGIIQSIISRSKKLAFD